VSAAPDARVALRARGLLESADLSLRFVTTHLGPFLRLSAFVALPGFLASLALRYALDQPWWMVWSVSLALAIYFEGAFTVLAGQLALSSDVHALRAVGSFAKRSVPFALTLIGVGIYQSVSASLMGFPLLFAALSTVFIPEVVLLERASITAAFRRAQRITSGFAGRAFALVLMLFVGRLAILLLVDGALRETVGLVLDTKLPVETLFGDGGSPYALAGLWASVPVCAAVRYFSYIDLRTIKEGWDLQRRFDLLAKDLEAEAEGSRFGRPRSAAS
jgi:hypothetical protein